MKQLIELCKKFNCKYLENEKMSLHTTFKIGGNARLVVYPQNEEQIGEFVKCAKSEKVRLIAIGKPFSDIRLIDDETIYAKAGAKLISLCRFAYEHSLSGLEFAYGIPGSAGGAAFMNAGAYGGEMKDVLYKCEHIDNDGNVGSLEKDELKLSYRHSVYYDNDCIITGLYLKLKKGERAEIKAKMDDFIGRRRDKQPLEYPSAGSTFKRPEGYFAGALIEECGLKGKSVGGAQVSVKHAGFVINKGGASCQDVLDLCKHCSDTVFKEKGVKLEMEIRVTK